MSTKTWFHLAEIDEKQRSCQHTNTKIHRFEVVGWVARCDDCHVTWPVKP